MTCLHAGPYIGLPVTHIWTARDGVIEMASKSNNPSKAPADANGRGRHRATTERTVDQGPGSGPISGGRRPVIGRPPKDVVDKLLNGK